MFKLGKDEAVAIVRADPRGFDVFLGFASSEVLKSAATAFAGSLQETPLMEGLLGFAATQRSWRGLGSEDEETLMLSRRGRIRRRILMECLAIVSAFGLFLVDLMGFPWDFYRGAE